MSKWRLRGFVQDSDEEEEGLDSASTHSSSSQRVHDARVTPACVEGSPIQQPSNSPGPIPGGKEDVSNRSDAVAEIWNLGERGSRLSPASPSITALTAYARNQTESPDPLQGSPTPRKFKEVESLSGFDLRNPKPPSTYVPPPIIESDEELSDPPSDDELPDFILTSAPRRQAVQVVIPSSTAAVLGDAFPRVRRPLRERKPIQLHPYLVEGERFRQEFMKRGIKPPPRPRSRSPPRRPVHKDTETQEQEFDPHNEGPPNSPPDLAWSSPVARKPRHDDFRGHAGLSSISHARKNIHGNGMSLTQPNMHAASVRKRRKLNPPPIRAPPSMSKDHGDGVRVTDSRGAVANVGDIWSIPRSPPESSSPVAKETSDTVQELRKSVANETSRSFPTPSNSSSIRGSLRTVEEFGSDEDLPSTRRVARFRPILLSSDDSASGSDSSDTEPESEVEVRRIGKKIKGVLPASWLRLDRDVQEKRKAATKRHSRSTPSPERTEPQRGVAQPTRRRTSSRERISTSGIDSNVIEISDGTDDEGDAPIRTEFDGAQKSAREASDLAAMLDSRYAEDDLDDMENDHLHLFSLGGNSRKKRKAQSKLTDAFQKLKKPRFIDDRPNHHKASATARQGHSSGRGSRKIARSRRTGHTPPPLSILDFAQTPMRNGPVPQFVKLAMRRVRQRPDQGRQSPGNKHIRLQTVRDTEEADSALRQWRNGAIKPKSSPRPGHGERTPLGSRSANRQLPRAVMPEKAPTDGENSIPQDSLSKRHDPPADQVDPPDTSHMQSRTDVSENGPTLPKKRKPRALHYLRPSFRAAQLESLESDFGKTHRNVIFERGLQRADQNFALRLPRWEPSVNPQLVRFLAEDDTLFPPVTPARDTHDTNNALANESDPRKSQRRLVRKSKPQRIDVDAREYRQPSEPALVDLIDNNPVDEVGVQHNLVLQGLGPFGSRYPTSFDVSKLAMGTYFHSGTFIGSDEFRLSLLTGKRDMDIFAGHHGMSCGNEQIQCGSWNDETGSRIFAMLDAIWCSLDNGSVGNGDLSVARTKTLGTVSTMLRSLIKYFSSNLSFLDSVDRQEFATRWRHCLDSYFNKILHVHTMQISQPGSGEKDHQSIRAMAYILVLSEQVHKIAQHPVVEPPIRVELKNLMSSVSKTIIRYLIRNGASELGAFLEKNKMYRERENGIQEKDILVECLVICMHTLDPAIIPGHGFWDLVSTELSLLAENAAHVKTLDSIWATAFTLIPFAEFDASGIPVSRRKPDFGIDNWAFVKDLLKRLFSLYPATRKERSASLNEYIKATLSRCHVLIDTWHWKRCESALTSMFDFVAKYGLKQLPHEGSKGSAGFLDHLADGPSLRLEPSDSAFHIFLKCLALGLKGMTGIYTEKKIRSVVLRCTPNHGRNYPNDQVLNQEDLDALRNHHDLLCTLYWAVPPSCRPKLGLITELVQHESSHREACRLNVRAWANLTLFQLSVDEPYTSLQPFAAWHEEIMQQTLKLYRLAKTEADDDLKAVRNEAASDRSGEVRSRMSKNQEHPIATLRDCIAGIRRAVKANTRWASMGAFLLDTGVVQLLELAQVDDPRLTTVIRETLAIIREYTTIQRQTSNAEFSQPRSEESQDYGDFPDLADIKDVDQQSTVQGPLDFIQLPLWHLLSNAFGAEQAPDDQLLMECVDTWVQVAACQVSAGHRSWSHYLDTYSQVSWRALRDTDQTRKFTPYFMALLYETDPSVYTEHGSDFIHALLVSLVERESMLRFQHRLLHAIIKGDLLCALFKNLPFYRDERTGEFDVTAETLRTRRLALLSSILANMQQDYYVAKLEEPDRFGETKREYSELLTGLMNAMKKNYQQLHQGAIVTGAYVEFVQRIVQFLKQHTTDICQVSSFFTDPATFPLPANDPTYVLGRLCGYAPKLSNPGVTKQLSTFVQAVSQQAAKDNQGEYLVHQLTAALTDDDDRSINKSGLRSILLQGIFPAYVEAAFTSTAGLVIALPILRSLKAILKTLFFELQVTDTASIENVCNNIWSISTAFVRGAETVTRSPSLLKHPHILHVITHVLEAMSSVLPILDYMSGRTLTSPQKPAIVTFFSDFSIFVAQITHDRLPHKFPTFDLTNAPRSPHADLLAFCAEDLRKSIKGAWSERQGTLYFGGREVLVDVGTFEEEKAALVRVIEAFHGSVENIYGDGGVVGRGDALAVLGSIS